MDFVNRRTRSRMMASVRSKNTAAEVAIRRHIFRLGFRYLLHSKQLPGRPDLVFPKHRAVVFINGCFWHGHSCRFGQLPATRRKWWKRKIEGNHKRDMDTLVALHKQDWRTLVIWECIYRMATLNQSGVLDGVAVQVGRFLHSRKVSAEISDLTSAKVRSGQTKD